MSAIQDSKWGEVVVHTWGDLSSHQWEDFRLALLEAETEQAVQGVAVKFSGVTIETVAGMQAPGVKVDHSPVIVRTRTEMVVSIVVSERDYKMEMLKYLPVYERKSGVFNEALTAYDREYRNNEQQLGVVERNMFLDTAIESLPLAERDLGIETIKSLRYDQRREQISSRYRASFDQTTEEAIKSVASAYSNGEVEVNKAEVVGVFEVKFIGTLGIPDNLDGLKNALDTIIPAHLGLTYIFIFNTWSSLKDEMWGHVTGMTWDELRTWDEVS